MNLRGCATDSFLLGKCSEVRSVGRNAGSHHDPLSRLANCRSVGAHTVLIREVSITNQKRRVTRSCHRQEFDHLVRKFCYPRSRRNDEEKKKKLNFSILSFSFSPLPSCLLLFTSRFDHLPRLFYSRLLYSKSVIREISYGRRSTTNKLWQAERSNHAPALDILAKIKRQKVGGIRLLVLETSRFNPR